MDTDALRIFTTIIDGKKLKQMTSKVSIRAAAACGRTFP
jgi:hypothetical protein